MNRVWSGIVVSAEALVVVLETSVEGDVAAWSDLPSDLGDADRVR